MLVDYRSVHGGPFENLTGISHSLGQGNPFIEGHSFKIHCHREGRDLAFRDCAIPDSLGEEGNFSFREAFAVPLFTNDFLRDHNLIWM